MLRYALAILTGLILGCIFGLLAGIAALGLGFFAIPSPPLLLSLSIVTFACGFISGFNYGFQFILEHAHRAMVENDEEPRRAPLLLEPTNTLLNQLDRLQPAKQIKLLTQAEISAFEKFLERKDTIECKEYKKQLDRYQHYMQNTCGITLESVCELKDPVTIAGVTTTRVGNVVDEKPWVKIYDKQAIRHWIETKGLHAKEPSIGCDLSDPKNKIQIYAGFASWVCNFITLVRSILRPSMQLATEIKSEEKIKISPTSAHRLLVFKAETHHTGNTIIAQHEHDQSIHTHSNACTIR